MKILLYFLFAIFAINANTLDWSRMEETNDPKLPFLAQKLANKESSVFTYCTYAPQVKNIQYTNAELAMHVRAAFKRWTLGVASTLSKHSRAAEFEDIIKLLIRPIELQYKGICNLDNLNNFTAKEDQPDIALVYDTDFCKADGNFVGFFSISKAPYICMSGDTINTARIEKTKQCFTNYANSNQAEYNCFLGGVSPEGSVVLQYQSIQVVTHELGHAIGLDDEYKKNKNRSKTESSKKRGNGMMTRNSAEIALDDIEGLITLLDKYNNTERLISPSLAWEDGLVHNGSFYSHKDFIRQIKTSPVDLGFDVTEFKH